MTPSTHAIYLPDSGSLPPWAGITVAAVVLPLLAFRLYRLYHRWRAHRRHRR
ncbi:hypothetical protein ACFUIW_24550 [Streptomyces sp. NPDC057245]|uniref:hypothetical protein n=1 Tax=Streptomyces TaxID=1883 RepID=UPI001C1E0994|nr:hypothetical protein [Streptomyces sp. A108]MBU6531375.1 hypothetical protein [Streptomyces sp. A108]